QVRVAADDVVLAEAAEDHVDAATTLDVVIAVGRAFDRGPDDEVAVGVATGAELLPADTQIDVAVALDDVVTELGEDQVVATATGDVVVAEARARRVVGVVLEGDREVGPQRRAHRVEAPERAIDEVRATGDQRDAGVGQG